MTSRRIVRGVIVGSFVLLSVGFSVPRPAEAGIFRWWWRAFFSDDTLQTQIGEKGQLCTPGSAYQWGEQSQWIYGESDSCEGGGGGGSFACECCWDTNGNGVCDAGEQNNVHVCTAEHSCAAPGAPRASAAPAALTARRDPWSAALTPKLGNSLAPPFAPLSACPASRAANTLNAGGR